MTTDGADGVARATGPPRTQSFGQGRRLTPVDRFGVWLSTRRIKSTVGSFSGKRVGDFGCGYDVRTARSFLSEIAHLTAVDIAISDDVKALPVVTAIEGVLPDALRTIAGESLDVVLCISVLEHLADPDAMLHEIYRVLSPGGVALVNVPTWRGKQFLEFSAFRLGLSPASEMDDHKMYYDPKDLWPRLVGAGFVPHAITCRRHKFGLNTFAVCKKTDHRR